MKEIHYYVFDTDLGACGIAWTVPEQHNYNPDVVFLQLPDMDATEERIAVSTGGRRSDSPPPFITGIAERIREHLNGKAQDFTDISVNVEGMGHFTQQVLAACRKIPAGKTMSYSELAQAIQRPKAARAVGQALARNPIPLIIPCHRVLTRAGRAGGYSAPGGVETKKRILAREGVVIKA